MHNVPRLLTGSGRGTRPIDDMNRYLWLASRNMSMFENIAPQKEKLLSDLRQVIDDAEELLRVTADQAGDSVTEVRQRIQSRLRTAQAELSELQDAALTQVKAAGVATDEFVHQNPWASIGIGAALGLVVGLVLARRQ
jgi:ElaB/YqjD/DUF883 family membrane-anchored ribosome-binding protein